MSGKDERTTADEPAKEIDPGGTRPTRPPRPPKGEQPVRSGDQNESPGDPDRF